MRFALLVAAFVLAFAGSVCAELVGKDLIFNSDDKDGGAYAVKATNVLGTYFWYSLGDRCIAKVEGKSLDVRCSDGHWVMVPNAGDISMKLDNGSVQYAPEGSFAQAMFMTVMVDYRKRGKAPSQ